LFLSSITVIYSKETDGLNKEQIKDILGVDHKYCNCCRDWLTLDKFGIFGKYSDGSTRYNVYCIQCEIIKEAAKIPVKIPELMMNEIRRIVDEKYLGFETSDEFIREALRRSIVTYGRK
jgi:hypothetical protein